MTEMEKHGILAGIKHFAANDQESYREGLNTFYNEQAFREGALRGFEGAVRKGRVHAIMQAFNRQGVVFSSACYELNVKVVEGSLPDGLSINGAGQITGTPTAGTLEDTTVVVECRVANYLYGNKTVTIAPIEYAVKVDVTEGPWTTPSRPPPRRRPRAAGSSACACPPRGLW